DGLAHFPRHERRVLVGILTQNMSGPLHHTGAFGKRRVLPLLKRCVGLSNGITHGGWGHLVIRLDGLACSRINSMECHMMSSLVVVIVFYSRRAPHTSALWKLRDPVQRLSREVGVGVPGPYDGCVWSARFWTNCQPNRPLMHRCPCPTS